MERKLVVPIAKLTKTTAKWKRTHKASLELKRWLARHLKTENFVIERDVNELLWSNGNKNPPRKLTLHTSKREDKIFVSLKEFVQEKEEKTKKEKKEVKKIPKKSK